MCGLNLRHFGEENVTPRKEGKEFSQQVQRIGVSGPICSRRVNDSDRFLRFALFIDDSENRYRSHLHFGVTCFTFRPVVGPVPWDMWRPVRWRGPSFGMFRSMENITFVMPPYASEKSDVRSEHALVAA